MVKTNIFLGFALSVSLLLNLASSSTKSLLALSLFLLAIFILAPSLVYQVVQALSNSFCKLLQEKFLQFHAKVRQIAAYFVDAAFILAVQMGCSFRAAYNFLRNNFSLLLKKVRITRRCEQGLYEEDVYTKHITKKVVLLVSLPYGRSYSAMKSALGLQPPESPFIDWQSNQKSKIPSLGCLHTSIRHFALCIIPLEAWDDPTKSLRQKFQNGKFWELIGPCTRPKESECVSWNVEKIESIDSMLEVGIVSHSDKYVSEQFYQPLLNAWNKYQIVWWNSYDFSIRLAYLLRYSVPANDKLVEIRHKIEKLRAFEVMFSDQERVGNCFFGGLKGFATGWTLTAGSAFLLPVIPVAFPAIAVGSGAFGFGSGIYGTYLSSRKEPGYMAEWRKMSKTLEEKLPQLQGLLH